MIVVGIIGILKKILRWMLKILLFLYWDWDELEIDLWLVM